jgi:hypothetical protein
LKLLEVLANGYKVINIDETFITETFFTRRKWHRRGQSNSVGVKSVTPRINLITAIDNFGQVYHSMLQVNGDETVMKVYLTHLVKILDSKNPNWRQNTILLLDGARSHFSEECVKFMKSMDLPVMTTAPYSYDACPCELWFSMLKSVNLNANNLGTGKKYDHYSNPYFSGLFRL